jgi:hypothetical protein
MNNMTVWLTYDEAAQRIGIKPDSVRRRAAAKKWPRRIGNDGLARVGLTPDLIPEILNTIAPDHTPDESEKIGADLAAAKATITGLEARLADTQTDRDHWRDMVEKMTSEFRPVGIWARLFGRS